MTIVQQWLACTTTPHPLQVTYTTSPIHKGSGMRGALPGSACPPSPLPLLPNGSMAAIMAGDAQHRLLLRVGRTYLDHLACFTAKTATMTCSVILHSGTDWDIECWQGVPRFHPLSYNHAMMVIASSHCHAKSH